MLENYAINARFVTQPLTGVQRYCYELSLRLRQGTLIAPAPALDEYAGLRDRILVKKSGLSGHPWEQFALPRAASRTCPLFSPAGCGPLSHPHHVVTIHDVAVLDNPSWYSRAYALWYSQLLPALSKRARKILTVSQFCKGRIVERLRVPEDKVVVAWTATNPSFSRRSPVEVNETLQRLNLLPPYFLSVGAVSGRKNLPRLLSAWTSVARDVSGASLVIVGKEGLRFAAGSALGNLPERTRHLTQIDDEDLARLYTGARGLLFPSLYEGFGLPIIEAMACGCPVLTSNCTSMPEVAERSAVFVDPYDRESIADGIRRLNREPSLEARTRGLQRSREFSYERTAQIAERVILS